MQTRTGERENLTNQRRTCKLDFAKLSNTKVAEIMTLDVLFMDEVGV